MSIEGRIRIACAIILGLTIAMLLTVARTTRDAEQVNGVIAVATMVTVEQDGFDNRLRRVRTAIGDATRAAERGDRLRPAVWRTLRESLVRLRRPGHAHDRFLPAAIRADLRQLDVQATAFGASTNALIGVAETDPAGIRAALRPYLDQLKALETDQTAVRTRLSQFAATQSARAVRMVQTWRTGAVASGILLLLIALTAAMWIVRDVVAPLKRLSRAIAGKDGADVAEADAARQDEVGVLARNVALSGRILAEREAALRRVEHVARHDVLTGLPNRLQFDEALPAAIATATAERGALALLCVDVDRFKDVNDRMGHAGGDAVLCAVGEVLQAIAGDAALVCRIGGDEFALVLPVRSGDGTAEARSMAARLEAAFAAKQAADAGFVGISIGAALLPSDAADEARLRHAADMALYRAKQRGRGQAAFAGDDAAEDPASETASDGVSLAIDLDRAIADGVLELQYQPKMDLRADRIAAVEALVRWDHPVHGTMAPDGFVPLAERMGRIRALTLWALRQAVRDQQWLATQGQCRPVYVNISGQLLGDADFADALLAIVAGRVAAIGLEITETAIIDDPDAALVQLRRFADAGLIIAIDDYGAGWSSLTYLKRMPAHELKIDRSFISEISRSVRDPLLVRSTIDLAHALGLKVTAEGVETEAALSLLRVMGCDYVQGYWIARPMPLAALPAYLTEVDGQAGP